MGNWADSLQFITVLALPVLFGITLHEAAHGYAAYRLGDDTAARAGRLSLNPLRHIDPFGTVIMPLVLFLTSGFLFGYAKPVPVRADRLRHPVRDMALVAVAGPGTNLVLAILSALLLNILPFVPDFMEKWLIQTLTLSIQLNLFLMFLNMLPVPPLDGSRVLVAFLPRPAAAFMARLEPFGMIILLGLVFLPQLLRPLGIYIDPIGWLVAGPSLFGFEMLLTLGSLF